MNLEIQDIYTFLIGMGIAVIIAFVIACVILSKIDKKGGKK